MKRSKTILKQIKLVSIILPTFNEVENIILLIKEIEKQLKSYKKEVLVVDDNSPDKTAQTIQAYARTKDKKYIRTIVRLKNHGLTNSIQEGIDKSKGDVIVWLDCDLSMPPFLIPKLLKKIEEGYDISVGSRFIKGGGFKKSNDKDSAVAIFLSRAMNYTIQVLLRGKFKDYTSGFIAIKRSTLEGIRLRGNYGEYFIDLIYRALSQKYKIIEVPYVCLPRERGESKTGTNIFQYLRRGIKYVLLTFQLLFEKYLLRNI